MRIGASARPTDARNSATSRLICAGVSQLRAKRMKPSGSASRKNCRSLTESVVASQPKMTGFVTRLRLHEDAGDLAALERSAILRRFCLIHDRPGLNAVVGALGTETDARDRERQFSEHVGILPLQLLPFGFRRRFRFKRAELQAIGAGGCGRRWRRGFWRSWSRRCNL